MADFNDWSISSSTDTELSGVTPGGSPGEYIFIPPNDREKNIYTIMYSHNGVTGKTEYIVSSADCYTNECATDLIPPTVCFDPNQEQYDEQDSCIAMTVSYEPGNAKTIFTSKCWKFIGTSYPNQISNVETNPEEGESTIYYKQNSENRNIESVVTYKFKNETANVTGQSDVTIIQKPNECYTLTCENAPTLSKNIEDNIPSTGGDVIISYSTLGKCWSVKSKKIKEGYTDYATIDEDNDTVHVKPNTDSTTDIDIKVEYTFVNDSSGISCPKDITITQDGVNPCTLDTDCPQLSSPTTTVHVSKDGTGNQPVQVKYNLSSCWTLKSKSLNVGTSVASFTSDDGKGIRVEENTGNESRSITATYIFENTTISKVCDNPPQYVNIEQEPGCTCTCGVISRIDADKPEFHPLVGGSNLLLKRLKLTSQYNENDCPLDIFEPYVWPGYENKGIVPGSLYVKKNELDNSILEIRGSLEETNKKRAIAFGIKICGENCNNVNPPFYVFQRCYCGTDDCRNEYNKEGGGTVIEDHPMYMSGCIKAENPNGKYHADADSIYVDTLYVVPMKLDENNELKPMYATDRNRDGKVKLCHKENGNFVFDVNSPFWPDDRESNIPVLVTYNENGHPLGISMTMGSRPMIVVASLIGATTTGSPQNVTIKYDEDDHTENVQMYLWRDIPNSSLIDECTHWSVLLATDDETTKAGPNSGVTCCSEFITTIYQAKKGYWYNKDHRTDDMADLEICS